MLALLLVAMIVAGLNYNSNLGLAFAFLMASLGLVAMHHCHRNLLGLSVDVNEETEAFAGRGAAFDFMLRNRRAWNAATSRFAARRRPRRSGA